MSRRLLGVVVAAVVVAAGPVHAAPLGQCAAVPGVNLYQPRPKYVEGVHMPFRGSDDWK